MKVAVIGSGGREHALCFALKNSKKIKKIFCIPGNAGTEEIAQNINIDLENFEDLEIFLKENNVETVVIGPEKPLVNGIVDFLEKKNIRVFGPNKIASQLEGSKIFTKKLCEKYNIPTAKFGVFKDIKKILNFFSNCKYPVVVKADGLASGKGVFICENKEEAQSATKEIFDGKFGETDEVLIEEFLKGEEMSFFVISDGKVFKEFGTAQDHKRVFEGDRGKNTGGMGAYSPSRLESKNLNNKIIDKIIKPTFKGLKEMNSKFKGFLYVGLMIVEGEPFLIEYNVRMGDPECQTIIPKLKTDFYEIIDACINEKLDRINIEWDKNKTICIVLCSKGYPDKYQNNIEIENLEKILLKKNEFIFHAGTKIMNKKIFSSGGRVLNFVVKTKQFKDGRNDILRLINKLDWNNGFFRKDIGYKVID